jgi:hypothetical protein
MRGWKSEAKSVAPGAAGSLHTVAPTQHAFLETSYLLIEGWIGGSTGETSAGSLGPLVPGMELPLLQSSDSYINRWRPCSVLSTQHVFHQLDYAAGSWKDLDPGVGPEPGYSA